MTKEEIIERIENYFDGITPEELLTKMEKHGFEIEKDMEKEPKLLFYTISEGTQLIRTQQNITLKEFMHKASSDKTVMLSGFSEPLATATTSKALVIGSEGIFKAVFDNGLILEYTGEAHKFCQKPTFLVDYDIEWVNNMNRKIK